MTAPAPSSAPPRSDPLNRANVATFVAFTGSGLALSSWMSRIPQICDQLGLDPFALGLVPFAVAAGSLVALPLAGPVIARVGSRRVVGAAGALAPAPFALAVMIAGVVRPSAGDRGGVAVGAADDHDDSLVLGRGVGTRADGGERGSATGLDDQPQL